MQGTPAAGSSASESPAVAGTADSATEAAITAVPSPSVAPDRASETAGRRSKGSSATPERRGGGKGSKAGGSSTPSRSETDQKRSGKHSDPLPKDTSKEKLSTLKGVSDPSKEEPKVLEETAEEAPLRTPKKTPSQSPAALSTTTAETPVVSSKDTSQLAAKKSSDAAPEKPLPSQAALSGSVKEQERTAEADRADQALTAGLETDPQRHRVSVKSADVPHITVPETTTHTCAGVLKYTLFLALAVVFFLVALDTLSAAFKLVSGRTAGRAFTNSRLLTNPVVGLMIGVLVTVMVQSSSSSTSVTVSMVGSNLLTVRNAVPIVMGANVGTSVTNTMMSLMHIKRRDEFRRGFAAATVHDIFNWLTVLVLLPCEVAFHMLEALSDSMVDSIDKGQRLEKGSYLGALTKPIVKLIVQLDGKVIEQIALGKEPNNTILKQCCEKNGTECIAKCAAFFNWLNMGDTVTGAFCFALSVVAILICFYVMVKVLTKLTQSHIVKVLTVCVNRDYEFPTSMLVGYMSLLMGCLITFVFQSSSAFTSALLPFAALGMLDLSRVYPLTLGSNVGTTATGIVAAMAGNPLARRNALQIALCHTFFNIIGILLYYPLPFLRLPLFIAQRLGETGARYRWFVLFYLLLTFVLIPLAALLLSLLGDLPFSIITMSIVLSLVLLTVVNVIQERCPGALPVFLQNWDFLPEWMHSLQPMDRFFTRYLDHVPFCQMFLNEMSFVSYGNVDNAPVPPPVADTT